jgi:hypothetical protein
MVQNEESIGFTDVARGNRPAFPQSFPQNL